MVVKREMDFSDLQRECWSGAVDTLQTIWENDKEDELMDLLEAEFCDEIPTMTEVNDLLWFEDDWLFELLGINPEEDEEEEDDDYDEDFEYELSKGDDEYTERTAQEIMERS